MSERKTVRFSTERDFIMIIRREMGTALADTTMSSPVYLDTKKAPFSLHGFCEPFRRVPKDIAEMTSETVARLSEVTAGGRVRFRTNSDFIVIHGDRINADISSNSSPNASTSFDMFKNFEERGNLFKQLVNSL